MKKSFLLFILFSIMIGLINARFVMALEQDVVEIQNEELTAYKETVKIEDNVGEYDVHISVPGKDGNEQHNEVILMVDGSYSMDEEWEHMKAAIIEIGKSFLNGTGNIQLTLMAFGMGDNEVLTHVKSVDELEKSLGELPGTLLYGRSSTNCEAGFTGVIEYIQNHDDTLNNVYVVYISDGNINTDETPYTFYNWKENTWLRRTPEVLATWAFNVELEYILYGDMNASLALETVFGENYDVETLMETATTEQIMAWVDIVWDAVYENAGFDKEVAYTVSDMERAFVDYDNKYNTHIQEAFYYALWGRSYPNMWTRTPVVANELALMEEVISLYLVDYDSYSSWMDTGVVTENSQYIQSVGISGLIDALSGVVDELSKTSYNNSVITDYTSKWVNPIDQNGDGVFNEKDITVTYNDEIVESPVVSVINLTTISEEELLELPLEEQNEIRDELSNDPYLSNNASGFVYRIKWLVKEGMLKASDRYSLSYKVKVDTQETGYVGVETEYNANGEVSLTYDKVESSDGTTETITTSGIVVKEDPVIQKENVIVITKTDENGELLSGADFEISSNDSDLNIIKEYSVDGINWEIWDSKNPNYDAMYFRFRGLYDYKYTLSETKIPQWYVGAEDKEYDFTNMENQYVAETIENVAIKGDVIVHYVVKVSDDYIPFNEFAYDDEGNLLTIFEGVNIEDVVLKDKVGVGFETYCEKIEALTLNGLYIGNVVDNPENLNRLDGDKFVGTFKEGVQEFTYVYELNVGNGSPEEYPLPPQTGYETESDFGYNLLICLLLFIKKIICLI